MGEGNFLKEAFLPPHPHPSRTLKRGDIFFTAISALDRNSSTVERTLYLQINFTFESFWRYLFSKR